MENGQENLAGAAADVHATHNAAAPSPPEATGAEAITSGNNAAPAPPASSSTQKRPQRRGAKEKPDHPERALFCLGLKNPVRAFCISIVDSKWVRQSDLKHIYLSRFLPSSVAELT